ncbi:MAG TPA: 50S ribosomal protein L11 methyltransferase [Stellaceae bacterium]|jgi:predicted nicotinamide N-methyase|nr:50S ribosomal protein L11 methyltransferase [Stellaceae bacterium]
MPNDPADFIRANTEIATPPLVPEIRLYLASEVTTLWQMTEVELGRANVPPPYWAFAWPGGQALARYLLDRPDLVRGKRVMDIGAGSGLAAIAALKAGAAHAAALEIDPFAANAIYLNGALNGAAPSVSMWDFSAITGFPRSPERPDIILIGDMCYERPLAERLLGWLQAVAADGIDVLLGDPGRAYLPPDGLELLANYDVPTSLDLEDRTVRRTSVYRWRA